MVYQTRKDYGKENLHENAIDHSRSAIRPPNETALPTERSHAPQNDD
jgi:hypothetical protein